jgi:hypothetical protein
MTAYPAPQTIRAMTHVLARAGQARRARRWLMLFENRIEVARGLIRRSIAQAMRCEGRFPQHGPVGVSFKVSVCVAAPPPGLVTAPVWVWVRVPPLSSSLTV